MAALKFGSTGAEVKILQQNLKKLGYSVSTDGIFGNDTRNVVISFQHSNGLAADGVVGPNTQTVIAELLTTKPIYGIDTSHFQGVMNWEAIDKNMAAFVYCKASQGKFYKDDVFAANFSELSRLNIIRGTYHFLTFMGASAAEQVSNFLSRNIDYKQPGMLPPVVDVEWQAGGQALDDYIKNNKAECQQKLMDWLKAVEKQTGRKPIIYTAAGFWNDIFGNPAGFEGYDLWVASYGPNQPIMPGKWKKYLFWQFTGAGHIGGYNGQIDRNLFNGNLKDLKKLALL